MKTIDSAALAKILNTCMPSEDMARFLTDNPPSPQALVELIRDAPVPLRTKVEAFEALGPYDPSLPGDVRSAAHQLAEHRRALEEATTIGDDEFLCLLDCGELTPDDEWDEDFSGVFASINDALAWISAYYNQPDDLDPSIPHWFVLEKWRQERSNNNGRSFSNPYTFYLIDNEVCYFEKNRFDDACHCWRREHAPFGDLNLRTPYAAGDIVVFHCRPFTEEYVAVVVEPEREDVTDCCWPQILYRNAKGHFDLCALKHLARGEAALHRYSPLYNIRRLEAPANEAEAKVDPALLEAVALLDGSAERGSELWNALNDVRTREDGRISDEALRQALSFYRRTE